MARRRHGRVIMASIMSAAAIEECLAQAAGEKTRRRQGAEFPEGGETDDAAGLDGRQCRPERAAIQRVGCLAGGIADDDEALFPNQFVNIRLLLDTHKNVVIMPTAGVQRGVPGTFVYLVNPDNTVSVRKIELGITDGDNVEVKSGLQPGDKIVIDGADKLRDGAKINVRTEADTNVTPAGPSAGPSTGSSAAPAAAPDNAGKGGKRRHPQNGQKQDSGQQQ